MHPEAGPTFSRSRKAIRVMMLLNFVFFVLFVIPVTHRLMDKGFVVLRAIHLEDPVGWSLQVWLIGSTVVATALFAWMLWKKRRAVSSGISTSPIMFEGVLLLVWWVVLVGACGYGFMLGMGG